MQPVHISPLIFRIPNQINLMYAIPYYFHVDFINIISYSYVWVF
jgi:hypothetical protein